ncbi:NAD(P) transhydrogenase subunit alpha [Bifidobacterium sp. UTCIF-37]|uniref:NAD(P) transhydrogenase subunit alpha n=1 Tax=unclassified Bifidobacterium TaxID=2608897 RepID=UPI00112B5EC5|nr:MULTISPECIES: NAD(P) transhydrogenase subunit alpha [unclassified Bifidobacterium]TPF86634.1 NAD(P) transhydrogenase subunit alpha [Bifidobacterium sp. UTCIF-37]TPF90252.1 NAD(P) transhydrogenase subunit alpha [Bifidobacterium sp. UTCIF-38]
MAGSKEATVAFGVLSETSDVESRVALTPDIVTRLGRSGVSCLIEGGAGAAAHYTDDDYTKAGATVATRDEVIAGADVLGFVDRPDADTLAKLREGQWVIGMLGSFTDAEYVAALEGAGLVGVAMERLPRQLSSAQSMDEMTSQNSVMGYKAAILAADAYGSFLPMMTTAAGTIRPAKALVLGAGIAGLQAIGTLRRLGAVVTAYDVRPASKGEVESLGAKFLDLGLDFSKGQGEGGYARALTPEEQAQQQAAVDEKAAGFDIVITTAKVPGRKPPVLLTKAGVDGLKRGAVIVDCAASDLGGNVEGSAVGTHVTDGGVTIIGAPYLASGVATTASNLLSRNVADVLAHFVRDGRLAQDLNEELDSALIVAGRVEAPTPSASGASAAEEKK